MNCIYKSETMVVHDDREFATIQQAIEKLKNGETVHICDPPDYGAEDEDQIFDSGFRVTISDFIEGDLTLLSQDEINQMLFKYLQGYEISF
jgi:hypothetical protein